MLLVQNDGKLVVTNNNVERNSKFKNLSIIVEVEAELLRSGIVEVEAINETIK